MTRSSVLSNDELRALVEEGWTYASIAGMTGLNKTTIRYRCDELGIQSGRAARTKKRDDGTAGMAKLSAHADKVMRQAHAQFDDDPLAKPRTHEPLPARALTNSYSGCAVAAFGEAW